MIAHLNGVEIMTRYKPGDTVWTVEYKYNNTYKTKSHFIDKVVFDVHEKYVDWSYHAGSRKLSETELYDDEFIANITARDRTIIETQRSMQEEAQRRVRESEYAALGREISRLVAEIAAWPSACLSPEDAQFLKAVYTGTAVLNLESRDKLARIFKLVAASEIKSDKIRSWQS